MLGLLFIVHHYASPLCVAGAAQPQTSADTLQLPAETVEHLAPQAPKKPFCHWSSGWEAALPLAKWGEGLVYRWPCSPAGGWAAPLCSSLCRGPAAGRGTGGGSHPHLPGRVGAWGGGPAGSAHPTHSYWRPGSEGENPCGKTSDQESDGKEGRVQKK